MSYVKSFNEFFKENLDKKEDTRISLIEEVWWKYNPALHAGEYTELTDRQRKMIKKIIHLRSKDLSFEEIGLEIDNSIKELKSSIQIFTQDLIRRSLPQ
jgi:hypothetical protein